MKACTLLEIRRTCHIDPGHRSNGCGYFREKYCYLTVDCRMVKGKALCWLSIVDLYTGELLHSEASGSTPGAAKYGRSHFTRPRRHG